MDDSSGCPQSGRSGAQFSPCRRYRYRLWRRWSEGDVLNFIGLNPSTADERANDPTVERMERRARSWGYGGLMVTNLFAWRATSPRDMLEARDPVGPDNDYVLVQAALGASLVLCGWGMRGGFEGRDRAVLEMLAPRGLHVLRLTRGGDPYHPLYLPYSLPPVRWEP